MRKFTLLLMTLILCFMLVPIASATTDNNDKSKDSIEKIGVQVFTKDTPIPGDIQFRFNNNRTDNSRSNASIVNDINNSLLRSGNPPTSTWDLDAQGQYSYNTGDFWGSIYTNYKFKPYYDGTICLSINGLEVIQGGYDIRMYCSDGTSSYIGNFNETLGIYIDSLDTSKTYYFKFVENNNQSPYSGRMYGTIA